MRKLLRAGRRVPHSLTRTDMIIDQALLRAGNLPLEPPDDPLTHLTTLTLHSLLPMELDRFGIRRYSGLAGEITCLNYWTPIILGAAENAVRTEALSLFREDSDADSNPSLSCDVAGMPWAYYLAIGESGTLGSGEGSIFGELQLISKPPAGVRFDGLVYLLHYRLAESCLLKSNWFPARAAGLLASGVSLLDLPTSTPPSTRRPSVYAYN